MADIRSISSSLLSVAALLAAGCVDLPTPFSLVDDTKPRLVDFVYEPPEASPGDTVTMRAIFAGSPVEPGDISWSVSYRVLKNVVGVDTAFDIRPLDAVIEPCGFSDLTSCVSVRFVVPDNCISQSPMVRENMTLILTDELKAMLPEGFGPDSLEKVLALVDFFADVVSVADSAMLVWARDTMEQLVPGLMEQLPLITQLLSVPIRIIADVAGEHRIESDYAVSYTRRFARMPGSRIYINNNPVIDSVGIYKVKGAGVLTYTKGGDGVEYFRLFGNQDSLTTVPIDSGYSYFAEVSSGNRDSVYTLGDIAGNAATGKVEDLSADWMHRLDPEETESLSGDDLMYIGALGDLFGALAPPQKERARHFTIWVQVTDSKLGVLNRSQGSTVAEVRGMFSYSERYLAQFKKR